MKQRDASPAPQAEILLFRSDDNSPPTGHLTRKALLCVFAQEKILPFHFSMFSSVCKEVCRNILLFLRNKGAQELIFGIKRACQHNLIRSHAVFLCQLAEKAVAFHEAALQKAEARRKKLLLRRFCGNPFLKGMDYIFGGKGSAL